MKKLLLAVCVFCAFCACADKSDARTIRREPDITEVLSKMHIHRENMYSVETERCIDVVYDAACSYLDVRYDSVATDEKKLRIIRKADLKDEAGDVIPEMCEYDEIYHLVWPAGYPEK